MSSCGQCTPGEHLFPPSSSLSVEGRRHQKELKVVEFYEVYTSRVLNSIAQDSGISLKKVLLHGTFFIRLS